MNHIILLFNISIKREQALGDTAESQWQGFGGALCFETIQVAGSVRPGALVTRWPLAAPTSGLAGDMEEVLPLVSRSPDSTWIKKVVY